MAQLSVEHEVWPFGRTFTISRGSRNEANVVVAEARQNGVVGHGECVPYPRYGESVESVRGQIESLTGDIERAALQSLLPPGAARNAADCALWDLEAKLAGRRAWDLADLDAPAPVITAFTISLGTPDDMARAAAEAVAQPLLKVKLGGENDLERMQAVRAAAPEARLIVDANEAWTRAQLDCFGPAFAALGVELIEQPLPAGEDAILDGMARPVPLCADESCHDRATLPELAGRYEFVNIKLDKTGGLTEALKLADTAEKSGLGIMVGCMVGTSLAMAPATLLANRAKFVDLDGPLILAKDRTNGLCYQDGKVFPPKPELWG